jgi:hypothetical protein
VIRQEDWRMMRFGNLSELLVLPFAATVAILLYLRPDLFPALRLGPDLGANAVTLLEWGLIGGLGGVLATSTAFLVFCLLYSPLYLAGQLPRLFGPRQWVDRSEVRFYCWCFVLLCAVAVLAWVKPSAGVVAVIGLAGTGPIFSRFVL